MKVFTALLLGLLVTFTSYMAWSARPCDSLLSEKLNIVWNMIGVSQKTFEDFYEQLNARENFFRGILLNKFPETLEFTEDTETTLRELSRLMFYRNLDPGLPSPSDRNRITLGILELLFIESVEVLTERASNPPPEFAGFPATSSLLKEIYAKDKIGSMNFLQIILVVANMLHTQDVANSKLDNTLSTFLSLDQYPY